MKFHSAVLLIALAPFAAGQTKAPAKSASTTLPIMKVNGEQALRYTQEIVNNGPRYNGSTGKTKVEALIKKTFAHDQLEADSFTPSTPVGLQPMTNYIVRFPGKKAGVIVIAAHYETVYPLRNTNFVGANDCAASMGLMFEMANQLRGKPNDGYSIWLVFTDGEEAVTNWTHAPDLSGELFGSRHLAAKWGANGTLKQIKALFVLDMIGDKDLDIVRDANSTPWLMDLVQKSADKLGYAKYFFKSQNQIEDDHLPFQQRGVPVADIIDFDYGPHDAAHPDGYHHTVEDTMDKLSARSLTIVGDTVFETIAELNKR